MDYFMYGSSINWSVGTWRMDDVIANGVLRMNVWDARVVKKNKWIRIATADIAGHGVIRQRIVLFSV